MTYKLDQKDDRKILSIRKRSIDYKFYPVNKEKKLERFIDEHTRKKKIIPAPNKYVVPMETWTKRVSQSPVRYAHKR